MISSRSRVRRYEPQFQGAEDIVKVNDDLDYISRMNQVNKQHEDSAGSLNYMISTSPFGGAVQFFQSDDLWYYIVLVIFFTMVVVSNTYTHRTCTWPQLLFRRSCRWLLWLCSSLLTESQVSTRVYLDSCTETQGTQPMATLSMIRGLFQIYWLISKRFLFTLLTTIKIWVKFRSTRNTFFWDSFWNLLGI